jgi:hypothetical protein
MTGYRPGLYWQITWRFLGPLLMTIILVSSLVFMIIKKPEYQAWKADTVRYTDWYITHFTTNLIGKSDFAQPDVKSPPPPNKTIKPLRYPFTSFQTSQRPDRIPWG